MRSLLRRPASRRLRRPVYTFLTYRLVVGQGEPKVVAFVMSDPDRQTLLMIRIQNIGRDVATDVSFKASRPIPSKAWGLTTDDATTATTMSDGPLTDGIAALGPGDTRDLNWGQYGGLMRAVGKVPIELEITYRHGRRRLKGHSRLEIASYTGTDDATKPPEAVARHLEKIAKATEAIARDAHALLQRTKDQAWTIAQSFSKAALVSACRWYQPVTQARTWRRPARIAITNGMAAASTAWSTSTSKTCLVGGNGHRCCCG